jgi:hypothetical protein
MSWPWYYSDGAGRGNTLRCAQVFLRIAPAFVAVITAVPSVEQVVQRGGHQMRKQLYRAGIFLALFSLTVPWVCHAEYANPNPSDACSFMSAMGMNTRGYKNPDGIGYFCSSPYKELGTGFPFKNNIAYYAEGSEEKVTNLKLVLNVNSKQEAKQAHAVLNDSAQTLLKKALSASLPQETQKAILAGSNGKWKIGNANVSVTRADWPTGKGYEIKFIVQ